mgnify:CR=1 FL=1
MLVVVVASFERNQYNSIGQYASIALPYRHKVLFRLRDAITSNAMTQPAHQSRERRHPRSVSSCRYWSPPHPHAAATLQTAYRLSAQGRLSAAVRRGAWTALAAKDAAAAEKAASVSPQHNLSKQPVEAADEVEDTLWAGVAACTYECTGCMRIHSLYSVKVQAAVTIY